MGEVLENEPYTIADLPPPDTRRWVIRRKALVIRGVNKGLITIDEACARYALSLDEFLLWQQQLAKHGLEGLKVTRIGAYRARIRRMMPRYKEQNEEALSSYMD